MNFYFAPLEGITGYVVRNAFEKYYGGIKKYFTPFISPNGECSMQNKDRRDLLRENNQGISVIPQILTNNSRHFIRTALELREMGYQEINLNLGCPSGTVCSKGKGAGFLARTDELETFLEDIYEGPELSDMDISIKTRLGRFDPDEFLELVELFNRYPVKELIVHPRIQKDFYKGETRTEYYEYALLHSEHPVVYNGDLVTACDIENREKKNQKFAEVHPECQTSVSDAVMIGRGFLMNPELLENYQKKAEAFDWKRFRSFHDDIYFPYKELYAPDKVILYRMKELWTYWQVLFPEEGKTTKKILKCKSCPEYESLIVNLQEG